MKCEIFFFLFLSDLPRNMPFGFLFGISDLTLCSSDWFCFVLFCFVLFCFVLFCFVLFCFVFLEVTDLDSSCKTTIGRDKVRFDESKG